MWLWTRVSSRLASGYSATVKSSDKAIGCTGNRRPHHAQASSQRASSTAGASSAKQLQTTRNERDKEPVLHEDELTHQQQDQGGQAERQPGERVVDDATRKRRQRPNRSGGTGSRSRPRTAKRTASGPMGRGLQWQDVDQRRADRKREWHEQAQASVQLAQPQPDHGALPETGPAISQPADGRQDGLRSAGEAGRQRPVDLLLQLLQLFGRHDIGVPSRRRYSRRVKSTSGSTVTPSSDRTLPISSPGGSTPPARGDDGIADRARVERQKNQSRPAGVVAGEDRLIARRFDHHRECAS